MQNCSAGTISDSSVFAGDPGLGVRGMNAGFATPDSAKKLRASAVAKEASRSAGATRDKMADQSSPRRGYGLACTSARRASSVNCRKEQFLMTRPRNQTVIRTFIAVILMFALTSSSRAELTNIVSGILAGIGIYHDPGSLMTSPRPVVCHIDCIHPDNVRAGIKQGPRSNHQTYLRKLKSTVEKHSGLPYAVIHYSQLGTNHFGGSSIKALIVTRIDKGIGREYTERLLALLRETDIPTIGFCGGHQLIARAYGGKEELMRPLAPGEEDPHPSYKPGYFKEWCFMPVKIVRHDPLFDGLKDQVVVQEFHAFEIKNLPPVFDLLASTDGCRIQAIKHKTKLMYGTQFHPEDFNAEHPDGERIVSNFFSIVGLRPAGL
ncbi:MAG: gamma-glutamyl-gamma-aminobutyrate hydrolase family protein [Kiritimatiellae bacterium]|nr:gamma-glutamyl-gamma-aminobutyrate hydrolase family protein [Kiritimatiellia bacterium]